MSLILLLLLTLCNSKNIICKTLKFRSIGFGQAFQIPLYGEYYDCWPYLNCSIHNDWLYVEPGHKFYHSQLLKIFRC